MSHVEVQLNKKWVTSVCQLRAKESGKLFEE
jgi:hypothetical protein